MLTRYLIGSHLKIIPNKEFILKINIKKYITVILQIYNIISNILINNWVKSK